MSSITSASAPLPLDLPKPSFEAAPAHPASVPSKRIKFEELSLDVLQYIARQFKDGNRKRDLGAFKVASRKMNEAAKRLTQQEIPIDVRDLDKASRLKREQNTKAEQELRTSRRATMTARSLFQ
jgi:hypothetical protein